MAPVAVMLRGDESVQRNLRLNSWLLQRYLPLKWRESFCSGRLLRNLLLLLMQGRHAAVGAFVKVQPDSPLSRSLLW